MDCLCVQHRVIVKAMLLDIGIALVIGLVIGLLAAQTLGQNRQREEQHRSERLEADLALRTTTLTDLQQEHEAARRDQVVREARHSERDATQREVIATLTANCAHLEQDGERAAEAVEALREENTCIRNDLAQAQTELATLQTKLEDEQKNAAEKQALFADQFKLLAVDILEKNSDTFASQNRTNIEALLKPVGEALDKLQATTHQLETQREGAYQKVLTEIGNIRSTHEGLRRETMQLTQALRAPKARGNWGELQLQRCVEFAGMVEHASFDTEVFIRGGEDDKSIRPDCVVYLPNERTIVIDVKAPFDAFLDAMNATDEVLREKLLIAHAARVREHVSQLSAKAYWKQFKDSPDFVVCFLPSEVLFSAALEQDPDLIEFGSTSGVILATPTTLIALLKAVAYGWQQMDVTRHAIAIKETGQRLYDKLATAQSYFSKLGNALAGAVGQYNNLIGCIEGRDSVFDRARELHELGIGKNELPELKPLDSEKSRPRELRGRDWEQPGGLFLGDAEEPSEETESLELAAGEEDL